MKRVIDVAIKSIEKLLTKDLGLTNEVVCPVCKNKTELRLFESCDYSAVSVLLKKENLNFAVCPNCSSVFAVNSNYVKEKQNGTFCVLDENDLTILVKGNE